MEILLYASVLLKLGLSSNRNGLDGLLKARLYILSYLKVFSWYYYFVVNAQGFFCEHPAPNAERTIQQSLENILLNVRWLSRDADNVRVWLADKGY